MIVKAGCPRVLLFSAYFALLVCSFAQDDLTGPVLPRLPDGPHPRDLLESEVHAASVAAPRLVDGGRTVLKGRLELQIGGSWGAVCSVGFGVEEARVACREMGLTGGVATRAFKQGKLPYVIGQVQCRGGESALAKCKFLTTRTCRGGKSVGVICQRPAISNVRLAGASSPSYAPSAYTSAASLNPYTSVAAAASDSRSQRHLLYGPGDHDEGVPSFPVFAPSPAPSSPSPSPSPSPFPSPSPSVAAPLDGRVEVQLSGGRWGTVCDIGFGDAEAEVVCNMMGLAGGRAKPCAAFGPGTVPVNLNAVKCKGTETNLTQCQYNIDANPQCTHARDVGVECSPLPKVPVRLVGGNSSFKGRVEVKIGGRWGTVCGALGFNDAAAGVVCRKLGLSSTGRARAGGVFPPGKLPILMAGVRCKGFESELSGCTFSTVTSKCKHGQDVGVVCKRPTISGLSFTNYSNGGYIMAQLSTLGGASQSTICRDGFTAKDARVACATNGHTGGELLPARKVDPRNIQKLPKQINRVKCRGDEVDLAACAYEVGSKCVSGKSVAVKCKPAKLTRFRLVGGKDKSSGRVEVLYGGRWGSVCSGPYGPLTPETAQGVCRILGFVGGKVADFGPTKTTPILLGNLDCASSYYNNPNLATCSYDATLWAKKCLYGPPYYTGDFEFEKLNPAGVICKKK